MKIKKYSNEEFIEAVKTSMAMSEVLLKLGLTPAGGNYAVAKRRIAALGLDTSHMTGQAHLRGKTHDWAKIIPISEICVENSTYSSTHRLKNRLLKDGLLEHKCYSCGISEWNGKRLSLELEHKNGIHNDNRLENVTLLCPNCHSQTNTYRGKNKIGKSR